jgi:hypothetical protein
MNPLQIAVIGTAKYTWTTAAYVGVAFLIMCSVGYIETPKSSAQFSLVIIVVNAIVRFFVEIKNTDNLLELVFENEAHK